MRETSIILIFLFSFAFTYGQSKRPMFTSEICISGNRTDLKDQNTINENGFGIGVYQIFRDEKILSLVFGLEYTRTSQFKKMMYAGHFAHKTNVNYTFHWISIPASARITFGKKIKLFLETGVFIDFPITGREKGTNHSYIPNEEGQIEYMETEYDNKTSQIGLNFGFSAGVGVIIPISKVDIIIKPDYRYGLKTIYDYYDSLNNKYFRINIGIKYKWKRQTKTYRQ